MRAAISCVILAICLKAEVAHAQAPAPAAHSSSQAAVPPGVDAPAAGGACGAVQFTDEVIMGVSRTHLCPKPVDATLELLAAKLERAPSKSTTLFFEVLRELREHLHAQASADARASQDSAGARATQDGTGARATQDSADARATQHGTGARATQDSADARATQASADAQASRGAAAATGSQATAVAAAGSGAQSAEQSQRAVRDASYAAAGSGAQSAEQSQRAVRDASYAAAGSGAQSASDWRSALAENIEQALAQAKAEQHPSAAFAAVRGVEADLDPDPCLFMTSDAGRPDYACYVIRGTPTPQPLTKVSMQVYELSGFEDAYLAQRTLAIAYSALVKLDLPSLDVAIKRLELAERRWDRLRKRGYLQYPWELALSSALSSYRDYQACFAVDVYCTGEEGLDPERTRLIALHPGVGMGFSGFGRHPKPSADAALALSLELIGLTLYAGDFKSYFGASLGAVVNDGDFRDVRPGVFVHLTRWLHVGYLMSLFRNATRYDATLFLSSDLGTAFGADFLD